MKYRIVEYRKTDASRCPSRLDLIESRTVLLEGQDPPPLNGNELASPYKTRSNRCESRVNTWYYERGKDSAGTLNLTREKVVTDEQSSLLIAYEPPFPPCPKICRQSSKNIAPGEISPVRSPAESIRFYRHVTENWLQRITVNNPSKRKF
ncbi:hypothetical protein PUN28_015952 [Cardiocondyla obscurior]|uniref:Uncharacterized protein n=1 Tax=Cardiocondyla obscurior TaxID=286306 RepID=A0AAW2EU23_9HYME